MKQEYTAIMMLTHKAVAFQFHTHYANGADETWAYVLADDGSMWRRSIGWGSEAEPWERVAPPLPGVRQSLK